MYSMHNSYYTCDCILIFIKMYKQKQLFKKTTNCFKNLNGISLLYLYRN